MFFPAFEPLAIKIDDPVAYLSDFDDEISVINLADSYAPNAAIVICSGSYKHQLNREIFDGYAVSGPCIILNRTGDGKFLSLSGEEIEYFSFLFFFAAKEVLALDGAWVLQRAIPKPWPHKKAEDLDIANQK